jgi:GAF domain-containing protein
MQRRGGSEHPVKGQRKIGPKARKALTPQIRPDPQEQVTGLVRELKEAREQQAATADVLKVISRSTFDLQIVLDTLAESAARLCEAYDSTIFLRQGELLHLRAHFGPIPQEADWPIGRGIVMGRAFIDRTPVHIHDLQACAHEFPDGSKAALRLGHRTNLAIPLLRQGEAIGVLGIRRTEVKPFTDRQVELVKTFADQAVIAIENARLFDEVQARTRELSESLEQQTATSEVLKVISSSPGELEPIFNAILANATRICDATTGTLYLYEGTQFRGAATHHSEQSYLDYWWHNPIVELKKHSGTPLGRLASIKRVVHIPDLRSDQSYLKKMGRIVALVEVAGVRPTERSGSGDRYGRALKSHLVDSPVPSKSFKSRISRPIQLTLKVIRCVWPQSISRELGHYWPCRCSRKMNWSVQSFSTAKRCGHSLISRSSWLRTLLRRLSSRSRTLDSSKSYASALTIFPSRLSNRQRLRRC